MFGPLRLWGLIGAAGGIFSGAWDFFKKAVWGRVLLQREVFALEKRENELIKENTELIKQNRRLQEELEACKRRLEIRDSGPVTGEKEAVVEKNGCRSDSPAL